MAPAEDCVKRLVVSQYQLQGLEVRICRDFCGWAIVAKANRGAVSFPVAFGASQAEAWQMALKEVAYSCGKSVAEMLVSEDLNAGAAEGDGDGG